MDCREVRDLLREGKSPSAEAHGRECPACAALLAGGAALARGLALAPAPVPDVERLFASLEGQIAAERGALGWARSRPTWARRLLIVAAALPVGAFYLVVAGLRRDLGVYPTAHMGVALALLLGYALWSLVTATRPLQLPQPSATATRLRAALGIAVGFAVALLPLAHEASGDVPGTLHCYLSGLVIGSPVLLAALLLRRHDSLGGALLFAVGAGLVSNFTIQLVCPAVDHPHLVFGHATVALTFAAGVILVEGVSRVVRTKAPGALVLALALLGTLAAGARADDAKPARKGKGSTGDRKVVLLELYSSQGCSSCPAAEELLGQLEKKGFPRERVVAAGFHVDYWNTPWKDPFSSEKWTARQKAVARALKQDSYYTPELVWDGRGHTADVGEATKALERAQKGKVRAALSLEARLGADRLEVTGEATPAKGDRLEPGLVIEVLVLEDDLVTEVPSGENGGRTLRETAVVREVALARTVEKASRESVQFAASFAVPDSWKRESLHVAAVLRDPATAVVWQALDVALVTTSS